MDLAGSEKCANLEYIEDNIKGWKMDEMQVKAKDRVKEGKYINKSLFFLTQVINKKIEGGDISHIPYRNSALTKILKSSLGGNSKTCVVLCISPTKVQFEHSLQTLKFGLNVGKVECKTTYNITKNTTEETLRLLINEYQSRVNLLKKNDSEPLTEIIDENKMLWQQFAGITTEEQKRNNTLLLQFYADNSNVRCENEGYYDGRLAKTFIDALKFSCKNTLYWKSYAHNFEEKLTNNDGKQIIGKLLEVMEDCYKTCKFQTAKLEVYEHTEKWAEQLSKKELISLSTHFKSKLSVIEKLISNEAKPKNPASQKLDLKLAHNEAYINDLMKEAKSFLLRKTDINKEQYINEIDKRIMNDIKTIKEMISKMTIVNIGNGKNEVNITPSRNQVKNLCSNESSTKTIDPNNTKQTKTEIAKRPTSTTSHSYKKKPINTMKLENSNLRINKTIKESDNKVDSNEYEYGIFSNIQSLRQLKKNLITKNKTNIDDPIPDNTISTNKNKFHKE